MFRLNNHMSFDSEVREILNEGKGEDIAKALLAKTFPANTELQQKLLALDQTPSKGDVSAIIKFYNETKDLNKLTTYFNLYTNLKSKKIPMKKAPASFETFIKFTEYVDAAKPKPKLKGSPIAPTIEHEDSADKLVDTDELTIYKGDAQHKCVKYGEGYSFCISRPTGGNMYNSYRLQNESTFYFIFFKKIPKTDPDHILVLDHKKDGWEWTNQLNNTKETTWKEVVAKFPILTQYEDLFVKTPLADKEKANIQFLRDFKQEPSLKKFRAADRDLQLLVLKTGETIIDEIFTYLVTKNLWDYINEYVSVGPNLTPLQADAIEAKGGAILKQYLKTREIAIPQLEQQNLLKINKLDKNISYIHRKIEADYKKAWDMVAAGKYSLSNLRFLDRLPDNIPENITGDFNCSNNNQLTSLEGAPKSVEGNFYCNSNQLTSLKGAPESVGGDFNCYHNNLTSLEGAPESVGGDFYCVANQLTSLEGAPESVGGNFRCSNNQLTSLEGAPKSVGRDFHCADNQLTSLEGAPESVGGGFYCNGNQLTSLKGAPESVGRDFRCFNNWLTSLEGAPESVGGDFICSDNQLTSLEGAPESVGGGFYCNGNQLTSLEGAPKSVRGTFNCDINQLTSLEGAPESVGGNFYCDNNPVEFTDEDIKSAMAESKRKLKGNTISKESFDSIVREILNEGKKKVVETDQFNEGVKELLATFLGLGAIVMSGAKSIEDNLAKRPESNREKITALQAADKLIKAPQFHQAANKVIADLEAKEQRKEKREDNAAKKAPKVPVKAKEALGDTVIKQASDFILPSEILGNDIYNKANDKFMKPYLDDVGKWTIGVGHLIGKGTLKDKQDFEKGRRAAGLSSTLSRKEALELFMKDVSTRVPAVQAKFKEQWPEMSSKLKAALVDIKFRGDLDNPKGGDFGWVKLIKTGYYKKAAQAYLNHKEYKSRMLKKGTKGDGVVLRMNRNAKIISNEAGSKAKKTTGYAKVAATGR